MVIFDYFGQNRSKSDRQSRVLAGFDGFGLFERIIFGQKSVKNGRF